MAGLRFRGAHRKRHNTRGCRVGGFGSRGSGHRQREPPDELTFNLPLLRVGFPDVEDFLRAHEEFFEAHESLESFVPASPIPLPLAQLRQAY